MRYRLLGALVILGACGCSMHKGSTGFIDHPNCAIFQSFYDGPASGNKAPQTGLTKRDYLVLIESNIDFWKQHQNAAGAIIDPYEQKERQYSTPAFALASAILVVEMKRTDLLDASTRAMSFAADALANHTTADRHADFYIPILIHARRLLKNRVPASTLAHWDQQLRSIVPEQAYRSTKGSGNWNLVNVSGEMLRRKDGLVKPEQLDVQMQYIERCLVSQQISFTRFGIYEDPNAPLAYDAFPRLWLEDALADGAYHGKLEASIEEWLRLGALSTLLMVSPSGEWPCGGRSAHHQWNEAEIALICEIEAANWKRAGRSDVAGSLKRAAHLSLQSMYRWRRPTGELWIVKNFADPKDRFGYEGYSFFSQYNLLPMAMLAMAYLHADDSIAERPIPSESAAYVFDLRDIFHKVIAAAGGTYVEIDTGADPSYNATGLQRIHKAGIALPPLSDSTCSARHYSPPISSDAPAIAMSPGIQWQEADAKPQATREANSGQAAWHSLGGFSLGALDGNGKPYGASIVLSADLRILEQSPDRVGFLIRYALEGEGARTVEEQYSISADGVDYTSRIPGKSIPACTRVLLPVLVNDGRQDTDVRFDSNRVVVHREGGSLSCEVVAPTLVNLQFDGPRIPCHNGWMQAVVGALPTGCCEVHVKLNLSPDRAVQR